MDTATLANLKQRIMAAGFAEEEGLPVFAVVNTERWLGGSQLLTMLLLQLCRLDINKCQHLFLTSMEVDLNTFLHILLTM